MILATRHLLHGALAGALLAAPAALAQPGGPVEAALRHLEAGFKNRCPEVWASYSKATQEDIRAEVHRRERERAGAPVGERPEEAHCGRSGRLKPGSTYLESSQGDEAIVRVVVLDRVSRHRYDLFPPESEFNVRLKLVREAGVWKVERPRVKRQPTLTTLIEVGAVDVRVGDRVQGLHQRLEATAVSRVPVAAYDAVLRDPSAWATALPSFAAIESMERAGGLARVRLSFAEPARPMPFTVRVSEPRSPMEARTLQWAVEGGTKAPAYMRGRWDLTPHVDGTTRVRLTLVIDPRHWPEGHFTAERLGNAVLELEKAAASQPR